LNSTTMDQLGLAQSLLAARSADPIRAALAFLQARMTLQALVRAFEQGFLILAVLFCLSMSLVMLLKRPVSTASAGGAH